MYYPGHSERLIQNQQKVTQPDLLGMLKKSALLAHTCAIKDLRLIAKHGFVQEYNTGQNIYFIDQHAYAAFLLLDGVVKLNIKGIRKSNVITGFRKKYSLIGLRSCLFNIDYPYNAQSATASKVLTIPREIMVTVAGRNPFLYAVIAKDTTIQMRQRDRLLCNLMEMNVREKSAFLIKELQNYFCLKNDPTIIEIPLKRFELASMVGISQDRVIKQLSEFKQDGIIEILNGAIKIMDQEALDQMLTKYPKI